MSFNCRLLVSIAFAACVALLLVAVSARADEDSNTDSTPHKSFSSWVSRLFSAAVDDSGNRATRARELAAFSAIRIKDSTDVDIQIGTPQQVSVVGDEKRLDTIDLHVDGNCLIVSSQGSDTSYRTLKVKVQVPAMDAIDIEGSGDAALHGIDGGKLRVGIAGSGDVRIEGKVDELALRIEGSGDARLKSLNAKTADVEIDGSGDADVSVADTLHARVNGSGDITYGGHPHDVYDLKLGSGEIRQGL
jgi:hypothetical protein